MIGKLTFAGVMLAMTATAWAQADTGFPQAGRTIEIIVPYAAGGAVDLGARMMAEDLQKLMGMSVVVLNQPGGGSQSGLTELVQAKPDGYTLSYVVLPTVATHYLDPSRQAIYTRESFTKIGVHFASQYVISVLADSPFKTLDDLVAAARANPGTVTVADAGLMTAPHIVTALLGQKAGVELSAIHYAGGAPALSALRSGEVQALAASGTDTVPYLENNEIRVLGVATAEDSPMLPGQPTMRAQGYDVIGDSLTGIVAPPGVPADIVDKLQSAIRTVVENPTHADMLRQRGSIPDFQGPEDFDRLWKESEDRLAAVLPTLTAQP